LEAKLLSSIGVPNEVWNKNNELDTFIKICNDAIKENEKKNWVPTVIFEIEGSASKNVIIEVVKTSKMLSSDYKVARCIICLSDSNAAISITTRDNRQKIFWVPDFSIEQANLYLDKLNYNKDENIRKKIFEIIGTRPSHLYSVCTTKLSLDEHINNTIEENERLVISCLIQDQNEVYKSLLKEMIKHEKLDLASVVNILKKPIKEIVEGSLVKQNKILSYNIETGKFNFYSKSMKTAVEEYFKEQLKQESYWAWFKKLFY